MAHAFRCYLHHARQLRPRKGAGAITPPEMSYMDRYRNPDGSRVGEAGFLYDKLLWGGVWFYRDASTWEVYVN